MIIHRFVLGLLSSILCASALAQPAPPPRQAVAKVEIERYIGVWYEVALIPNKF